MNTLANNQPSLRVLPRRNIAHDLQEFLIDRQARNLTRKTLLWYSQSLGILDTFLRAEGIDATEHVTPSVLRRFLLHLAETGHNPGGVKNIYGAVKAFLTWYGDESAPQGWASPARKVKMPRVPEQVLEPVNLDVLRAMLATCQPRTFAGDRDKALLLFLLDSGVRHQELADLTLGDVDLATGGVLVRSGKGRKPRVVFISPKTRRAMLAYLRHKPAAGDAEPLWVSRNGGRLSYGGIREVLRRRAKQANVPEPSLHSFRRGFALAMLRGGADLVSLQRLLGHADLSVLRRYLAQNADDLQAAHQKASPVDRLLERG